MPVSRRILCPHCRLALPHDESAAGTTVVCGYCGQAFVMPRASAPAGAGAAEIPRNVISPPNPAFSVPSASWEPGVGRAAPRGADPVHPWPAHSKEVKADYDQDDYSTNSTRNEEAAEEAGENWPRRQYRSPRPASPPWQTVQSGLRLYQIGCLLGLVSLVVLGVLLGPLIYHESSLYGDAWHLAPGGAGSLMCGSGTCLFLSVVLIVIGQAMICSAPFPPARNSAIFSLILLLFGLVFFFVQLAATGNSYNHPYYPQRFSDLNRVLALFGFALTAASHVLLVLFLRRLGLHFADRGVPRQSVFYLVFFGVFLGLSVVTMMAMTQRPYGYNSHVFSHTYANQEMYAVGGFCFGCVGLFLGIALISFVQQARTLLRDRLALALQRREAI